MGLSYQNTCEEYEICGATHHVVNLGVYAFGDDVSLGREIFEHLGQSLRLQLLALEL